MTDKDQYISAQKLIQEAINKGIDFGKGDPYNRLRYYTKMGWLPHMIRKKGEEDDVKGHYPTWVLERLLKIENLKKLGYSNEELTKKINEHNTLQSLKSILFSKELRLKTWAIILLSLIVIIVLFELKVLQVRTSGKVDNIRQNLEFIPTDPISTE